MSVCCFAQIEKVQLDAEASLKRLEAETALARAAAAQTEATYKSERAAWVTSLDAQKFEVSLCCLLAIQSCLSPQ